MSMIKVENLTFSYPSGIENIFENVSFTLDTDWKLGFVGRNGRGKTTFLNLLLGKYEYAGTILSSVLFQKKAALQQRSLRRSALPRRNGS